MKCVPFLHRNNEGIVQMSLDNFIVPAVSSFVSKSD